MADAADVDVGGERVVLQERKRLSESVIWELQDAFYKDINIRSWSDRCVRRVLVVGGGGRHAAAHCVASALAMALRLLLLRPPVHSAARCPFVAPALGDTPALFSCYPSTTHAHSRDPTTLPARTHANATPRTDAALPQHRTQLRDVELVHRMLLRQAHHGLPP